MTIPRHVLSGKRVVLRPNSTEFVPFLYPAAIESLSTVGQWMSWCHSSLTEAECISWYRSCEESWNDGTGYEFSVFAISGEFLGAAGLNQFNRQNNFANLGYWIRESCQRQGYALEAAEILIKFGFRELALGRIEIVVAENNYGSRRVAERSGAILEGLLRNRLVIHGVSTDAAMYSLLASAGG